MEHYNNIADLHRATGFPPPENPMISLVHCDGLQSCSIAESAFTTNFYMIGFKKMKSGIIRYGRTNYDHDHGSLSFVKPRQVIEIKDVELEEKGFLIFIHEDYFNGHPLHQDIKKYGFFDYEADEALHLSPREEETVWEVFRKLQDESQNTQDEFSREIILSYIDSLLKQAQRFYKRQFLNRKPLSGKTVTKFNEALEHFFSQENGLPTVRDIAASLNTSPRYMSDLLKQETGKTALELIHIRLIGEAKDLLLRADTSVSEIAYRLGFENPPYFSRLFRKETGISPNEFKKSSLN